MLCYKVNEGFGANSTLSFVCADWNTEGSVAVDREITSGLGSRHCPLHQQLGLLHTAHLPADVPQEHPPFQHEKRKYADGALKSDSKVEKLIARLVDTVAVVYRIQGGGLV